MSDSDKEADNTNETQGSMAAPAGSYQQISFSEFLEGTPPGQQRAVADLFERAFYTGAQTATLALTTPHLHLHCTSEHCNGPRFFRYAGRDRRPLQKSSSNLLFIQYKCSNCGAHSKTFALLIDNLDEHSGTGRCYKFGELPLYGPPTPARLLRLFGGQRETFLKGRRCENQGLGVGAFAYYRRVVETQKNAILDEIIKASTSLKGPSDLVQSLQQAKKEVQFTKAIESVKNALPEALLINGHNPLTLLHSALSKGLHEQSDERCLELAHDIRIVLAELAERISQVMKDDNELNSAVSRLLRKG